MSTQGVIGIAIIAALAIVVIALALLIYRMKRQSKALKSTFGPEYDRAVQDHGDRAKAEAELKARKERMSRFRIVPLSPTDAAWFSDEWRLVQARFVDNPEVAVNDADRLVSELMRRRGYPVTDFENRAADLSVHHPTVVANYRAAHEIALRNERGAMNTEDLRQAIVRYRSLFDELLEVREPVPEEVKR